MPEQSPLTTGLIPPHLRASLPSQRPSTPEQAVRFVELINQKLAQMDKLPVKIETTRNADGSLDIHVEPYRTTILR